MSPASVASPERTWWEKDAPCTHSENSAIYFEIEDAVDEGRVADAAVVAEALECCETCEVQTYCYEVATRTSSVGIWGGTTSTERGILYTPKGLRLRGEKVSA